MWRCYDNIDKQTAPFSDLKTTVGRRICFSIGHAAILLLVEHDLQVLASNFSKIAVHAFAGSFSERLWRQSRQKDERLSDRIAYTFYFFSSNAKLVSDFTSSNLFSTIVHRPSPIRKSIMSSFHSRKFFPSNIWKKRDFFFVQFHCKHVNVR